MLLDFDHAVAVARRPAVTAGLSLAGQSDPYIAINTRRNRHPPFNMLDSQPFARTGPALLANYGADAAAGGAGRLLAKDASRLDHLTVATAILAGLRLCALLCAAAIAGAAELMPRKLNCLGRSAGGFQKRQRYT